MGTGGKGRVMIHVGSELNANKHSVYVSVHLCTHTALQEGSLEGEDNLGKNALFTKIQKPGKA